MKMGFVYILSNFARTTLYIGVTSNLEARIAEHRNGTASQFTSKYKIVETSEKMVVYCHSERSEESRFYF
jgi:predicted GIY-YIG superfamily endonuclease